MWAWVLTLLGCAGLAVIAANVWVVAASRAHVYNDSARLPDNMVGLVLGTSPLTRHGNDNRLFDQRIQAAARLYRMGKVKLLLLSGANPSEHYNEPRAMYEALAKAGVPGTAMRLDFAGYRTLDSMFRARRVFDLGRVTIVSQRFHDYRAVFIARHIGLDAVAYAASPRNRRLPLRTAAREYLARVKAVLDLYVLHTQPRFLGKQLPLTLNPKTSAGKRQQTGESKQPDDDE